MYYYCTDCIFLNTKKKHRSTRENHKKLTEVGKQQKNGYPPSTHKQDHNESSLSKTRKTLESKRR